MQETHSQVIELGSKGVPLSQKELNLLKQALFKDSRDLKIISPDFQRILAVGKVSKQSKASSLFKDHFSPMNLVKSLSFPYLISISLKGIYLQSVDNLCWIRFESLQGIFLSDNNISSVRPLRKCYWPAISSIGIVNNLIKETSSLYELHSPKLWDLNLEQWVDAKQQQSDPYWLMKLQTPRLEYLCNCGNQSCKYVEVLKVDLPEISTYELLRALPLSIGMISFVSKANRLQLSVQIKEEIMEDSFKDNQVAQQNQQLMKEIQREPQQGEVIDNGADQQVRGADQQYDQCQVQRKIEIVPDSMHQSVAPQPKSILSSNTSNRASRVIARQQRNEGELQKEFQSRRSSPKGSKIKFQLKKDSQTKLQEPKQQWSEFESKNSSQKKLHFPSEKSLGTAKSIVVYQREKYREHIKVVFEHYCKLGYSVRKNPTFDEINQNCNIMTIHNFMTFCKDFNVSLILDDRVRSLRSTKSIKFEREDSPNKKKQRSLQRKTKIRLQLVQVFKKGATCHRSMSQVQFCEVLKVLSNKYQAKIDKISGKNVIPSLKYTEQLKKQVFDKLMRFLGLHTEHAFSQKMSKIGIMFREKHNYHNSNTPKCAQFVNKYKFALTPYNGKCEQQIHEEILIRRKQRQTIKSLKTQQHQKNKTNKIYQLYKNGVENTIKKYQELSSIDNAQSRIFPGSPKVQLMPMMRNLPKDEMGNKSYASKSRKAQRNQYNPSELLTERDNNYQVINSIKSQREKYDYLGRKIEVHSETLPTEKKTAYNIGAIIESARKQVQNPKASNYQSEERRAPRMWNTNKIVKISDQSQLDRSTDKQNMSPLNFPERTAGSIRKNVTEIGMLQKKPALTLNQRSSQANPRISLLVERENRIQKQIESIQIELNIKKAENKQSMMRMNRLTNSRKAEEDQLRETRQLHQLLGNNLAQGISEGFKGINEDDEILKSHFLNEAKFLSLRQEN